MYLHPYLLDPGPGMYQDLVALLILSVVSLILIFAISIAYWVLGRNWMLYTALGLAAIWIILGMMFSLNSGGNGLRSGGMGSIAYIIGFGTGSFALLKKVLSNKTQLFWLALIRFFVTSFLYAAMQTVLNYYGVTGNVLPFVGLQFVAIIFLSFNYVRGAMRSGANPSVLTMLLLVNGALLAGQILFTLFQIFSFYALMDLELESFSWTSFFSINSMLVTFVTASVTGGIVLFIDYFRRNSKSTG